MLPDEPCVSTCSVDAGFLGRGDQRVGGHVGVRDAGRAGGDRDQCLAALSPPAVGCGLGGCCGCVAGLTHAVDEVDDLVGRGRIAQRLRRNPCAPARGPGWTAASCARRRRLPGPRSGTPDRRVRRVRRSRPAGFSRANPIDAVSTYGERQCGIAMPPGSPVADCSSRAIAARDQPVGVVWCGRRRRGCRRAGR